MKRIGYAIATVILLLIEVLIALYVHDAFVRPYIGDVLVVIVIYTFIRIFVPERCKLLPLYVFIFAALVEFSQMFHIVEVLGWQDNRFLSVLVGSVFDWKDIQCYAAGGILLVTKVFAMKGIKIELLGIVIIPLGIAVTTNNFGGYVLGVLGFGVAVVGCFLKDNH